MNIKKFEKIEIFTQNFQLLTLNENRSKLILEYYMRNKDFFDIAIPTRTENYFSINHQIDKLLIEEAIRKAGKGFRIFIFSRKDKEHSYILGDISVYDINFRTKSSSAGYKVDSKYKRRGIMKESLSATMSFLFDKVGIDVIYLHIISRNVPSLRLANKLGFRKVGVEEEYLEIMGKREDHLKLAYTRMEYEAKQ